MNKTHKAIIFSTTIIPFILAIFVSTSSISSELRVVDDNGKKIVLAKDEVDLTMMITLISYTKTNQKTGDVTESNTQSVETRMIDKIGKIVVLKSDKLNLEVETKLKKHNENQILVETKITFKINGKEIIKEPSLLLENNKEGQVIIEDKNYKLDITMLPRF